MNKEKLLKIEHIISEIKEVCGSCENHSCSLYPGRHSWTSIVDCRLYDFVSRRPSDVSFSSSPVTTGLTTSTSLTGDINFSCSIDYKQDEESTTTTESFGMSASNNISWG